MIESNRNRLISAPFVAGIILVAVFLSISIGSSVFAAVGGTGNGSGGGGGGQYYTSNGHGWYKYDVDSPVGPEAFDRGLGNWGGRGGVQERCRADGADKVAMFVVQGRGKSPPRGVIVMNDFYGSVRPWYLGYNGDKGGNWMNRDAVRTLFNQLPASQRQGYTFGRDVAWFCYQERTRWRVDSGSYIKVANDGVDSGWSTGTPTAKPGDRLNFKHTLIARDADVDRTVYWTLRGSGFPSSFGGGSALINNQRNPRVSNGAYVVRLGNFPGGNSSYTIYSVTQNDVGKNLCQRLEWSPTRWNDGGISATPYRCATIPYNYSLVPRITVPDSDTVVDADRITTPVRGTITASGPTKSHTNIQWRFTQIEYPANLAVIPNKSGGARISSSDPCTFFTAESSCQTVGSGTDVSGIGHLASKVYTTNALREPRDVGTKICFSLSVRRNSSSSADWRHSDLQCLIIGKKPKVQVQGSGLSVGRSFVGQDFNTNARIETNITSLHGVPNGSGYVSRTFGSWSEYGVFAPGDIRWLASASGLSAGSSSSEQSDWSSLSFTHANSRFGCAVEYGCYVPARTNLPNVTSLFSVDRAQSLGSVTSVNPSDLVSSSGENHIVTTNQSTLVITGGMLDVGHWAVLNAPNTHVVIAGDIRYESSLLTSISDIPQLVIIARDITIANNVEQVDAWLVAQGALATCDQRGNAMQLRSGSYYRSSSANLTADNCDRELTVNGPVIANQLYLRRTAGSERATSSQPLRPGEPAEIFNLRPDAYLWARNVGSNKVYRTTSLQELPPRY